MEVIRSMIDRIVLAPRASRGLEAILYGELGAILAVCAAAGERPSGLAEKASQLTVVAGTRNRLNLQLKDLLSARSTLSEMFSVY